MFNDVARARARARALRNKLSTSRHGRQQSLDGRNNSEIGTVELFQVSLDVE